MSTCPYCAIPIQFPTGHNGRWGRCPQCNWYVRELSLPSGVSRVDLGGQTPTGIEPLTAGSVASRPVARPPTVPRRVILLPQSAQTNQARTSAPASTQNTPQNGTSNSPQTAQVGNISLMNLNQVHTRRKELANELLNIETRNQAFLNDLGQNYNDPGWVSALTAEMIENSQGRNRLFRINRDLNSREDTLLASRSQPSVSTPSTQPSAPEGNERVGCGVSAVAGIAGIVGFTLYAGVQQWDLKTVAIMLGVGLGIAFIGWMMGKFIG